MVSSNISDCNGNVTGPHCSPEIDLEPGGEISERVLTAVYTFEALVYNSFECIKNLQCYELTRRCSHLPLMLA